MLNHRVKPSYFLYAFSLALLLDMTFIELSLSDWRLLSKGSLMPFLILHIIFFGAYRHTNIKQSHLLALIFSFIGDMFLQFDFFIPGLISFLCAHLSYIYLIYWYRGFRNDWSGFLVILFLSIPAYFLGSWLTSEALDMQLPVILYAFVILNMSFAIIRIFPRSRYLLIGSLLFLTSDLILALGLFKDPLPHHSSWVMLTYGLAQLGLLLGILRQEMKFISE